MSLAGAGARLERRWALVGACAAIAAALAAIWLALGPPTPDLAAQVYRADLFADHGFTAWENQWFGGHHVLGYSLVFPELGAWIGARSVGALTAVLEAALFAWLLSDWDARRARAPALWFAVGTVGELMIGRITFALGTAIGIAALIALQRKKTAPAVILGALCAATSPVAGLFLVMAAAAIALAGSRETHEAVAPLAGSRETHEAVAPLARRRAIRAALAPLAVAAAALAVDVVLAVAFPEGGAEPFSTNAALVVVAIAVGVYFVVAPQLRVVRYGALLYALGTVAAYALPTAMGSNATRPAALLAGPIVLAAARTRRAIVLAVLVAPLALYQVWGPVREVRKGIGDPSVHAAYYQPVIAFLKAHDDRPARLEVPFTRAHWESVFLARVIPLARGWEGQLDVKYDRLFHYGVLTARAYDRWLGQLGVRWVAVPDVPLDPSGTPEAALIAGGLPFLALRERTRHWAIYEVTDARPLASGPGRLVALGSTSFSIVAYQPGTITVKVRFTPYWALVEGAGCVQRTADGFTSIRADHPGPLRVSVHFSFGRIDATSPRCRGS